MCVVSLIGDHYSDKWKKNDWLKPYIQPNQPPINLPPVNPWGNPLPPAACVGGPYVHSPINFPTSVSKEDFDALKKEVLEMKELLKKAIEYDKRNNEPHCEMEEKVVTLKKVAELFKVDLSEIFKEK